MAQQPQPQYEFHYQRVELLKTEELGVGSYGAVCKAMCDDLPCAAKLLHRTLFQFTAPGATSVMRKFEQECRLLSAIKHARTTGTLHKLLLTATVSCSRPVQRASETHEQVLHR